MLKAVLSHGEIRPVEPLPSDWREGPSLRVEKADDGQPSLDEIDQGFAVLAATCQESDAADEEQLDRVLQEARQRAKEQVRRQMGLG